MRCKHATSNGLETLGLFAAAVVAGNTEGIPEATLNGFSLDYFASRVADTFTYMVLQESRKFASLRSLIWLGGTSLAMTLFVQAGRAMNT